VPKLNKILGFFKHFNANLERVFSLMSNKLTDQRNQGSLELIKSELAVVAINYDYTFGGLLKYIQDKKSISGEILNGSD
jgi:hypothetical protein